MRQLDPESFTKGLAPIRASEARIDEYEYYDLDDYPEFLEMEAWQEHEKETHFSKILQIDLSQPVTCFSSYTSVLDSFEKEGNTDLTVEKVRARLQNLADRLRWQPFNYELFDQTSCLVQSLAYRSNIRGHTPQSITYLATGENSGITAGIFSTEYAPILFPRGKTPLFLLKTATGNDSDDDMLNEAIVGLYSTNRLRKKIPTFMYVYGTFLASMVEENFASGENYAFKSRSGYTLQYD